MQDSDLTLSSPLSTPENNDSALLCLTILWHPEAKRIGEQALMLGENLELARFTPLFCKPQQDGLGLGHGGISREPLRFTRDSNHGVKLSLPNSRMVVELNGREVQGMHYLSFEQICAGAILCLGRAVLLCLHWMHSLPKGNALPGIIGVGDAAIKLRDLIRQVAPTESAVLLLGETGTGKEVAARAIHQLSLRAAQNMVCVNMAALNESLAAADLFGAAKGAYTGAQSARLGFFQEADSGSLFLDEIGNAPTSVQPMLLRVLETADYRPLGATRDVRANARIIAATDQDLYDGSFNPALLRRLESFIVHLPPLRTRREDIGLLILHFLSELNQGNLAETSLPIKLVSQFAIYDWPGNIRQLRHILKRTLLSLKMGDMPSFAKLVEVPALRSMTAQHSAGITPISNSNPRKKLSDIDAQDVLAAMENNDWMIQAAAQELHISRPSMYKLLEAHPQIRRIDQITPAEIEHAWQQTAGDVENCASQLKTPVDALRRFLRSKGCLS